MKKIMLGIATLLLAFGMAACGENGKVTKSETKVSKKQSVQKDNNTSFKRGILKTKKFTLKILKSELIKSKMEDHKGLFVTYEIRNTSKEKIVPNDTLLNFKVTQNSDTSEIELESNYYFYDAFAPEEDTKTYNSMLDKGKLGDNSLLPGKTTKFYVAYSLDNDKKPIIFTALDPINYKEIGQYKVNLK